MVVILPGRAAFGKVGAGTVGKGRHSSPHRWEGEPVPERTVVIASRVGLHARPAAVFVKAAAEQPVRVTIRKGDSVPVDAASILAVMTLGAEQGDEVTLAAEGDGAEEALEALAALLETDLDAANARPSGT